MRTPALGPRSAGRPALALCLAWLSLACVPAAAQGATGSPPAAPSPSAVVDAGELTVFAAASLSDVVRVLAERWDAEHPANPLVAALDASNILAAQIEEGAPADVFLSASATDPSRLADGGFDHGQPTPFAWNRVTIVAPAGDDAVQVPADLARAGVRVVAAGEGVPITAYADAALEQLAATLPEPEAYLAGVRSNVVSREDNVRAVLAKVELGEGDAAVVYATDARSSDAVREVPLPDGVDVRAEYVALGVSDRPATRAFLAWLTGTEGASILAAAGFDVSGP